MRKRNKAYKKDELKEKLENEIKAKQKLKVEKK